MDNTEEFRCISLCTGYAGLELGLKRVIPNLRTIAYVEREGFACANLVAKIEAGFLDAAPIWTDIKTFDGKPFYKKVHIITAGYPCQPFATVGNRKGTDDSRHLWPYIERLIKTIKPIWCFFENVRGHLTLGYPDVYRSLRNLGYKVEQGIFSAAEVGAPHLRERLYILAAHTNCFSNNSNVGIGKTIICRQEEKEIRVSNWDEFKLLVGKVAPAKWRTKRQFNPQPLLVRNNDGIATKLDRLRLLGNGVVPQQVELAFRTLLALFK